MTPLSVPGSVNFRAAKTLYQLFGRSIQDNSERFPSVLVQELSTTSGKVIIYRAMQRATVMKRGKGKSASYLPPYPDAV